MIHLLIKGDIYQARAALDARHLLTTQALDPRESTSGGLTVGAVVSDSDLDAVVAWFTEPIPCKRGEGFPPGSLLLYSKG
jgi:hypothetical protein